MKDFLNYSQAERILLYQLNGALAAQLKVLLEQKHLYQKVEIDFQQMSEALEKRVILEAERRRFGYLVAGMSNVNLQLSETQIVENNVPVPTLLLQNVKLFCSQCKQRETFSITWHKDATAEVDAKSQADHRIAGVPLQIQLFLLVYQCETCKSVPVSFLLKRARWKLSIEGRSPIEEVEVPTFIPETEATFFRDATIAAQTGNVLAGLFYLRVFIEQFARRQTGKHGRNTGEEILQAYQELLPNRMREHAPSLGDWYNQLSAAMHEARNDVNLFDAASTAITEHFDFRRLYKIQDVTASSTVTAAAEGTPEETQVAKDSKP